MCHSRLMVTRAKREALAAACWLLLAASGLAGAASAYWWCLPLCWLSLTVGLFGVSASMFSICETIRLALKAARERRWEVSL